MVSLPFSAAVRRAFPRAEIWGAGPPPLEEALACDRNLTGFLPLPHPEWRHPVATVRALRRLRAFDADVVYVLGIQALSAALGRLVARFAVGYDYNQRGLSLDLAVIPHSSCNRSGWEYGAASRPPHITTFWGRLLREYPGDGIDVTWSGLDLGSFEERARRFLTDAWPPGERSAPWIVFHPWAGQALRSWPETIAGEFLDLVLESTRWRVVLTGGPRDRAPAARLAATCGRRVVSAAGSLSLGETWALLRRADLTVSVDTALIHMAAALRAPVVSLFGAGDPMVWGPWGQERGVVQDSIGCRRCKRSRCMFSGVPCMVGISPQTVLERSVALLSAPGHSRDTLG